MAIALPLDGGADADPAGGRLMSRRRAIALGGIAVLACVTLLNPLGTIHRGHADTDLFVSKPAVELCPQARHLLPIANETLDAQRDAFSTTEYRSHAIGLLSRVVQTRAESFDDEGIVGEDDRWLVFDALHDRLRVEFPSIHAANSPVELRNVNSHGLLYIWRGSDTERKPLLLMAHQDTVPVEAGSESSWTYPPFSGHDDGDFLWGRGACDCRSHLVAVMSAVEALVSSGFAPSRAVILSFGFDEESAGTQGAGKLAAVLEEEYGRDGLELVIDEGEGFAQHFGLDTAIIDTSEKGYSDVIVEVRTPGGHSMAPPPHTAIGMLSAALVELESAAIRPNTTFAPSLAAGNPFLSTLRCLAEHAPTDHHHSMDPSLRHDILTSHSSSRLDALAVRVSSMSPGWKWMTTTSQAIDVIRGGNKVNALPEHATATVNIRLAVHQTISQLKSDLAALLKPVARSFDLDLIAFNSSASATSSRPALFLSTAAELEPSPVSPSSGEIWDRLAGTVRHVWAHHGRGHLVVAPALSEGNTDTASYWNLSKAVYRFSPLKEQDCVNIHTVDERVSTQGHIEAIVFWYELIRNFDA